MRLGTRVPPGFIPWLFFSLKCHVCSVSLSVSFCVSVFGGWGGELLPATLGFKAGRVGGLQTVTEG